MGSAYLTDPILRVIDPEEMPDSFLLLPDQEQHWRCRLYLAVRWLYHFKPYAWITALDPDPAIEAEWRQTIERAPDEHYLGHWRGMLAEIAVETRKGLGE